MTARLNPPKTCKACGSMLIRRPTEKTGNWNRRQTCGELCRLALTRQVWAEPPIYRHTRWSE